MSSTAYAVLFVDTETRRAHYLGIFSEPSPTTVLGDLTTVVFEWTADTYEDAKAVVKNWLDQPHRHPTLAALWRKPR